jgi:hypothetical protein
VAKRIRTKLGRTRYTAARQNELDMRCLVRDWRLLREGQDDVQRQLSLRHKGIAINEVRLERTRATNKRLLKECDRRYERLHHRMDRLRVQAHLIAGITGTGGESHVNAAHP